MSRPVALLTGLGRRNGIAFGIARALIRDGWDLGYAYLTAHDRRYDALPEEAERVAGALAADVAGNGARSFGIEVDLADPDAAAATVPRLTAELGPASALVLSHAEGVDSDIFTTTVESFDRHYAVNARASWLLVKAFAEQAGPDGGAIVALTSDAVAWELPYGATKGALDRIVVGAASELAGRGIRANLINPGPIDTGWMDDETRVALTARQPTGRLGTPADTAELVSFLVSPAGAWITGQTIHSDGGFSLGR